MKKLYLFLLLFFSGTCLMAQKSGSMYETNRYKRFYELSKDAKYLGVALAMPNLKDGWKTTTPWWGVNLNMWEMMNFYWFRGEAEKTDVNGNLMRGVGYMGGYGTQIPFPLSANKNFNFFPYIGFEANWKYFQDPSKVDDQDNVWGEGTQIGFGLNPGVSLRLGPLQLRGQYHLSAGYSFNKTNAFNTLTAFPSVSVSVSSLSLLLNPREFSAVGLKHYVENYNQYSYTYTSKSEVSGDTRTETRTTVTHRSWTDAWRERTFSVMDIRPVLFAGPRIGSAFYLNSDYSFTRMVGANIGFKASYLWMNGFYERGSIALHDPNNREQLYMEYGNNVPNLSGKFNHSSRYGVQLGFDAVVLFQKSDFVPYDEADRQKIKTATSYYSVIPFVGYGKVDFGDFEWDAETSAGDYALYSLAHPGTFQPSDVVDKQSFINAGVELHMGAVALGFTRYLYKENRKQPQLNDWEVHLSWNIPVIRLGNAIKVVNMNSKLNRVVKKK